MSGPAKYASVTAVLSGGIPKPALTRWAAKAVAEEAATLIVNNFDPPCEREMAPLVEYLKNAPWRITSSAADLGSHVHSYVEAHNLGKPMPKWPLPVAPFMRAFEAWVEEHKPVFEAAEMRVYSRKYRFAGTLDALALIDGRRFIIDVKTGNGVYDEAAYQLSAYARADFCVADPNHPGARQVTPARGSRWYEWHGPPEDELPMPKIEAAGVLHLRPSGAKWYPNVDIGEETFETFLAAQAIFERATGLLGPVAKSTAPDVFERYGAGAAA